MNKSHPDLSSSGESNDSSASSVTKTLSYECLPELAGILPLPPRGCSKGKGCPMLSIPDS